MIGNDKNKMIKSSAVNHRTYALLMRYVLRAVFEMNYYANTPNDLNFLAIYET